MKVQQIIIYSRLVVQQIVAAKVQQIIHMQCHGCAFMVSSDSGCVSAVCACSPVELC